jgi:hypothetical protein
MAKFVWTISAYQPGLYEGKATFFWYEEITSERRQGWGRGSNAREVEIHIIPGTHDSCRITYLPDLTREIQKCLENNEKP